MYTINFWPILVASVVSYGIGALWYSPILFAKEWRSLTKMTSMDIKDARAKGPWKAYVVHFIAVFITFSVLGFLISTNNVNTAFDGAFLGFIVWFGFIGTEAVGALMWERKPIKLVLINTVVAVMTLVIGGAIIGAWK